MGGALVTASHLAECVFAPMERWILDIAHPGLARAPLNALQPNIGSWYLSPRRHAVEFLLVNLLFLALWGIAGTFAIRRGTKISSALERLARSKPPRKTPLYRFFQFSLILSWLLTLVHKYRVGTLAYMTQPCHMNVLLLTVCMCWPQKQLDMRPGRHVQSIDDNDAPPTPRRSSRVVSTAAAKRSSPRRARSAVGTRRDAADRLASGSAEEEEETTLLGELHLAGHRLRSRLAQASLPLVQLEWKWAYLPHIIYNAYTHHVWATTFALIAPDMRGYSQRLEATNFWVEHLLLLVVPFYLSMTGYFALFSWSWSFCLASFCVAALWHTFFLTLWSLASGWNLDYVLSPPIGVIDEVLGANYRVGMYVVCFLCACLSRMLVGIVHRGIEESRDSIEKQLERFSRRGSRAASPLPLLRSGRKSPAPPTTRKTRNHTS